MIPESENENDVEKSQGAKGGNDIINIEVNNKKGKRTKKVGNFKIKKIKRRITHLESKQQLDTSNPLKKS